VTASDKTPTPDVYAGDTASTIDSAGESIRFFDIEADSDAGTFARIANVLNIANTAPNRVVLDLKRNDGTLCVYIEIGVGLDTAHSIQRKLAQLTEVRRVDMGTLQAGDPRCAS
jgi:hypothetical protein